MREILRVLSERQNTPPRESTAPPLNTPLRQAGMAAPPTPTTFTRYIKVKDLKEFNGTPSDLESFNNAVKQCLLSQNLPLYYGGYLTGDPDSEYEYVAPNTAGCKYNYIIGKRLCAALTAKLSDNAKRWWEDYDSKGNAPPNC